MMVAMKWEDRLARIPMAEEQMVDELARALYARHAVERTPEWRMASPLAQEWMRESARAALACLRRLERSSK
jgi:hypothetical protein